MTEQQFEDLLKDSIKRYGHTYVPEPPPDLEPHVFSKRYERKMKRLTRSLSWRLYTPNFSPRMLFSRRGLAIQATLIILLSATTLTASGNGLYLPPFNIHDHQLGSTIGAAEDSDAPETFEQYYQVTWIPEGFERTYRPLVIPEYGSLNYKYSNGETKIEFTQYTKSDFNVELDTEEILYDAIEIQGYEGMIQDKDWIIRIYLEYEGYILEIKRTNQDYGQESIGKEELIKMLESVQEVSWETLIEI